MLSSALVYGDTSSATPFWLTTKESKPAQFIAKNLQFNLSEYDGSAGACDFFIVDERHHRWDQIGFLDSSLSSLIGLGTGYRYLFKEATSDQSWFLGVYAKARFNIKAPSQNWSSDLGAEIATENFQWTFNRYRTDTDDKNQSPNAQLEAVGYSIKLSTYYLDKINFLGKIHPFIFIARTCLYDKSITPSPIWNGGWGVRWQFAYVTLEGKIIKDQVKPAQFLGCSYQIGCQISLNKHTFTESNNAIQRAQQRSEPYTPIYYKQDFSLHAKSKPKETKIVEKEVEISAEKATQNLEDYMDLLIHSEPSDSKKAASDRLIAEMQGRLEGYNDPEFKVLIDRVKILGVLERNLSIACNQLYAAIIQAGEEQSAKILENTINAVPSKAEEAKAKAELAALSHELTDEMGEKVKQCRKFLSDYREEFKGAHAITEETYALLNLIIEKKEECCAYRHQGKIFLNQKIDEINPKEDRIPDVLINAVIGIAEEDSARVAAAIVERLSEKGELNMLLESAKGLKDIVRHLDET